MRGLPPSIWGAGREMGLSSCANDRTAQMSSRARSIGMVAMDFVNIVFLHEVL
jgi:hypothetical protein